MMATDSLNRPALQKKPTFVAKKSFVARKRAHHDQALHSIDAKDLKMMDEAIIGISNELFR
jgi:hypothetical protein